MAIGTAVYLLAYYWGMEDATADAVKLREGDDKEWERRYNETVGGLKDAHEKRVTSLKRSYRERDARRERALSEQKHKWQARLNEKEHEITRLNAMLDSITGQPGFSVLVAIAGEGEGDMTHAGRLDRFTPAECTVLYRIVTFNDESRGTYAVFDDESLVVRKLVREGVIERVDGYDVGTGRYELTRDYRFLALDLRRELLERSDMEGKEGILSALSSGEDVLVVAPTGTSTEVGGVDAAVRNTGSVLASTEVSVVLEHGDA